MPRNMEMSNFDERSNNYEKQKNICVKYSYCSNSIMLFSFSKQRWIEYPNIRYKMIDDIEKNNSIIGKTQQEVRELLGEPDNVWEHDFEDGYYNYYQYYIGKKHEIFEMMWEPDMYLVTFRNGVVVSTSVQPT